MWHFDSWNNFYSEQLPKYNDFNKLQLIESILQQAEPLVPYSDVIALKKNIGLAINGKAFVLQLGECSESFVDCFNKKNIFSFYDFFITMAKIIADKLNVPVIKIGRIAGQFAKPRSQLYESDNILAFRGEVINSYDCNQVSREPNTVRMLFGYFAAKTALKYLDQAYLNNKITGSDDIDEMYPKLYTSHESLLLNYEASLTRKVNHDNYNLSAHMVWLGARTSFYHSPHIEYLKGVSNPIGIKIHKNMTPLQLINLINLLNPTNQVGQIILIIRLSNDEMPSLLPQFLTQVLNNKLNVLFMCDPMHGNTKKIGSYKVRYVCDIINNTTQFIDICNKYGVCFGGLHLEATYLDVTECIGGEIQGVTQKDLPKNYRTTCDPRLNYNQTQEVISKILNCN